MDMLHVWQLTWLIALSSGLLSFQSRLCRSFVLHGKTRSSAAIARSPFESLVRLEVPKRYFTWFYLLGALHSILMLTLAVFWQDTSIVQTALHFAHAHAGNTLITIQPHTVAFLTLFSVHTSRRFLESFFITEFGNATMHGCIVFVGGYHYVATVLSVLFDPDSVTVHELSTCRWVMGASGLLIFSIASYHQSCCNYLLAKQKRANGMKHVIPQGDWFKAVRSPLYTTEIMLYGGFLLITGCTTTMLYFVSAWVLVNQILLAEISSKWIDTKFRDRLDEIPKYKLLPYIW